MTDAMSLLGLGAVVALALVCFGVFVAQWFAESAPDDLEGLHDMERRVTLSLKSDLKQASQRFQAECAAPVSAEVVSDFWTAAYQSPITLRGSRAPTLNRHRDGRTEWCRCGKCGVVQ